MRPQKDKCMSNVKNIKIKEDAIIDGTKNAIIVIRNRNVILDSDLARIYGEETKRINEKVKRNIGKFPDDFMFQLSKSEFDDLKSQIATSNTNRGGRRSRPYIFTEHGALQIANLINSDFANNISVFIIRAFVEMRETIVSQQTVLSLWPLENLPPVPGSDKVQHLIAYAALMFPIALRKPKYWPLIGLLFIAWSGPIELLQPYVNRYGE